MGPRVPADPGRLLAAGRACDVFEHGTGAVLRRYREGEPHDTEHEAAMMRRARGAGVPVPEVLEVHPDALVLARVDGPTMLAEIERRAWRFVAFGKQLGRIHRTVVDTGLVHGDFHPQNVLLSASGPVVIDWSNAREGEPEEDVAFTQVILATSEADFPGWLERLGRAVRRRFVRAYLDGVGIEPSAAAVAEAVARRRQDPHLRPGERAALEALQPSTK